MIICGSICWLGTGHGTWWGESSRSFGFWMGGWSSEGRDGVRVEPFVRQKCAEKVPKRQFSAHLGCSSGFSAPLVTGAIHIETAPHKHVVNQLIASPSIIYVDLLFTSVAICDNSCESLKAHHLGLLLFHRRVRPCSPLLCLPFFPRLPRHQWSRMIRWSRLSFHRHLWHQQSHSCQSRSHS